MSRPVRRRLYRCQLPITLWKHIARFNTARENASTTCCLTRTHRDAQINELERKKLKSKAEHLALQMRITSALAWNDDTVRQHTAFGIALTAVKECVFSKKRGTGVVVSLAVANCLNWTQSGLKLLADAKLQCHVGDVHYRRTTTFADAKIKFADRSEFGGYEYKSPDGIFVHNQPIPSHVFRGECMACVELDNELLRMARVKIITPTFTLDDSFNEVSFNLFEIVAGQCGIIGTRQQITFLKNFAVSAKLDEPAYLENYPDSDADDAAVTVESF